MKISYKVLFAAVFSIAGTNVFAADVTGLATTNYVKGAIQSLDSTVATGTGAIDTITQTDGKITATRRTLKNADIAADAAIATSKISGLDTALGQKQLTSNIVNPDGDGNIPTADAGSTTKYPSIKAAEQIAAAAASNATTQINSKLTTLETDLGNLEQAVEDNKGAAEDAIAALDSSVTNANGAISTITITDGKITNVTRKLVSTNDLATTVQTSLGKADNSLQKAASATYTNGHVLKVDASGNVVDGGALGGLATKDSITEANISGNISNTKISGLGALATKSTVASADITDGAVTGKKIASDAIKGSGSVTVSKDATTGVITVNGTDTKYTLPTATTTVKGGIMATSEIAVASDGKATIGANAVTEGKIADDAVTTAKIKGFDNSGTTKECAAGNCALVDLGTGAQWLPIVNEYN